MDNEILEEKIGECLGLERAAQKAVGELESRGLLDEPAIKAKIMGMREEAGSHEQKLQQLIEQVEELDPQSIEEHAQETVQKASEMMVTYLGENPDTLSALEFLSLAEGGEVIHYEVLSKLASEVKSKKFGTAVRSILRNEKEHLQLCIRLAKQSAAA